MTWGDIFLIMFLGCLSGILVIFAVLLVLAFKDLVEWWIRWRKKERR